MKIFYTHKAIDDLDRLHHFISKNNPKAAMQVSERLLHTIKNLLDFPMLGRKIKNTKDSVSLRDLIIDHYVIRYALLHSEIHILNVWHTKEDRDFSVIK